MNPAAMIIDELHRSGVRIRAIEGGQLGLAPRSRLTPDIVALIRRHKPELLALLEQKRASFAQVEARRLIRICREHGVDLRLEPDGTLVVTSNGRAWRSLV